MDSATDNLPPNHHAHHPAFGGPGGLLAAASMLIGRDASALWAADLAGLEPGDHVVDIGCGPGVAARLAARRGATVIGIDPAPVMLRVARLASGRTTALSWRLGSAEDLPLDDDSADVAWSLSAVHHWADIGAGLAETRRVLRQKGRFVATERLRPQGATGHASHGWTRPQAQRFAQACGSAGFVEAEVLERQGLLAVSARVSSVDP